MEFGQLIRTRLKCTKDIIVWIKSQDMVFINGKMDGLTRGISKMTSVMDLVNFMRVKNVCIEDTGKMDNRQIKKAQEIQAIYCFKTQCQKHSQKHHHKFTTEKPAAHKN